MYFNRSTAATWDASISLPAGWHHVAATPDASARRSSLWVDGALLGTSTVFDSFSPNGRTLWLAREHVNTSEFSRGFLGGVHLANAILYTGSFTPTWPLVASASTQGLWDMTANTGTTLEDDSGSLNGTIHGATWGSSCR